MLSGFSAAKKNHLCCGQSRWLCLHLFLSWLTPIVEYSSDIAQFRVTRYTPLTAWNEKKARIRTNIELFPAAGNGLAKQSIADCLQMRPIDYAQRMVSILGELTAQDMRKIDKALKIVFSLK